MRRFSLVLLLASAAVARADDEPPSVSADVAEEDGEALSGDEEALLPTPDGPICLRDAVRVRHQRRPREEVSIPLTHCDGRPNVEAVLALSVIARPWPLPRPSEEELRAWATQTEPAARRWIADGRRRIHPGLLVRLQALADRWPDRSFVIVSGHRPNARPTSRHRFGRALDLQVEGVDRFEVASFAQTLAHTGVGYYPNSTFTHVDVRERPAYWVDRSGPGEPPDYGPWPPPGEGEAYASRGSDDDARRHAMLAQL
ncbi:MAG: DUF882 domain-containing protein, partial [Myxococcales bacterium]|nr:DUF882 domain-containing protein [Myxococcales bacterium]